MPLGYQHSTWFWSLSQHSEQLWTNVFEHGTEIFQSTFKYSHILQRFVIKQEKWLINQSAVSYSIQEAILISHSEFLNFFFLNQLVIASQTGEWQPSSWSVNFIQRFGEKLKIFLLLKSSVAYIHKQNQNNFKDQTHYFKEITSWHFGRRPHTLSPMRSISVVTSMNRWPRRPWFLEV